MAIIHNEDSRTLLDRLGRRGYPVTVTSTSGGYLRSANTTIYCGVDDQDVEEVLGVIRDTCASRVQYVTPLPPVMEPGEVNIPTPVEKQVGGGAIFITDIEYFEKI